jgi:hypothetical protein
MFRLLKRRKAIKSFVHKLPLEMNRRFGDKRYYPLEEIERVFEIGKYDRTFAAYAYALLCSREDFDSYFSLLKVNCTYDGLRKFIGKKYLYGATDFDAFSIVRFAKGVGDKSYYESGLGDNYSGGSGHH